ncbi:DUF4419 domain-containing protein [Luteolibacter soli]|uniref:DUF4419 domain-containing protein n=1 Tax=Luteolibacter soli TaxID=3135280 RepID=A0ABU9B1C3_9BACT
MITFDVSDVEPGTKPLPASAPRVALQSRLKHPVEAYASNLPLLVEDAGVNGFVAAAHYAFMDHHPLVLSPDDVWLCIAQGFALHVDQHAEDLRKRLVAHEGKVEIVVLRDEFIKGSPDNDWQGCFSEFSDRIGEYVGSTRDLLVSGFSTTGPIEKAASEIVLMAAMRHYFDYTVVTRCGIPRITLLGTVEDWRMIRQRIEALAEFDFEWWVRVLRPVLDEFVRSAEGNQDRQFWRSFYKFNDSSGGPFISGWINAFFPYLEDQGRPAGEPFLFRNAGVGGLVHEGICSDRFPSGMSLAPFVWDYLDTKIPMKLFAGFAGVSQDPCTLEVRSAIGWAVAEGT